jgi:hypothetical protein
MDHIAEVIDVLGKVSVFCDDPQYRHKITEIQEFFLANRENKQQYERMLKQLEQICKDIYEGCRNRREE